MNTQPEPAVVCENWYLELPKVFSDAALLMKGLQYFFDIKRGDGNVHSTSFPRG